MSWTIWMAVGAIFAGLGVAAGAFGAHALKARISPENIAIFETGARYQMYHALALLAVGLAAVKIDAPTLAVAGWAFCAGIVIFSGSLYALALSDLRWLGMVTPVGGVAFLVGWVALAAAMLRPVG
jgi:uncharacterized membrane protein YgdD (TMEM256/DUF423 family)